MLTILTMNIFVVVLYKTIKTTKLVSKCMHQFGKANISKKHNLGSQAKTKLGQVSILRLEGISKYNGSKFPINNETTKKLL